jgi:hypothetical protein
MWVESPKEKRNSNIDSDTLSERPAPPKIADRRIPKIYLGAHSPSIVIALDPVTRQLSFHRFDDTRFDENSFPGLGKMLSLPPSDPVNLNDTPDQTIFVDDSLKDLDASLQSTLDRRARMMLDPLSTLKPHNIPQRSGTIVPDNEGVVPNTDVSVHILFWQLVIRGTE